MNHLPKGTFAVAFSMLSLIGCGNTEADEFLEYLNGPYEEFLDMEEELESFYDKYDHAYTNGDYEEVLTIVSEDLSPQLESMAEHVEGVSVDDDKVRELHDMLVEETQLNLESVRVEQEALEASLEENNEEQAEQLMNERNELIDEVDAQRNEFVDEMNELMDEHEINYQ